MRLWILTQYYPPEFGAAAVRLGRLARTLAAQGHAVTVLTSLPNYPAGVIPPEYRGRPFRREVRDGVTIRRVWVYATPGKRTRARLLNQISFMLMAALRGTFLGRPDAILVESHPLFVCLAGGWLRRIKRAPIVLNVSDLWPESAVAIGAVRADSLFVRIARRVERGAYRDAEHVVAMTGGVRQGIIDVLGKPDRVTLIQNAVDLDRFRPGLDSERAAMRARLGLGGKFVAAHIGNMSLAHDFDLILDAAAALPDIAFVLAGGGSKQPQVEQQVRERALRNVHLPGILPHDDMPALWAATDACLIAFTDHPLFAGALPSKMFEALATGTPVVAAVRGEAETLLRETGAGVPVPPGDRAAMIDALRQLAAGPERRAAMSAAARTYAESALSPERVLQAYLNIFQRAAARHNP